MITSADQELPKSQIAAWRENVRTWQGRSVNRRILGATVVVGFLTFLVYGATALKEILVARHFGVGDALDAYLVAFAAQTFLIQVLATSFSPALVPIYVGLLAKNDTKAAHRLFSSLGACTLAIMTITCILLGIFSGQIFSLMVHRFGVEKIALTSWLFRLMLPAVVLRGTAKLWAAVLNSSERFALAAVAPIGTPIFIALFLVVMGRQMGVYALATGTVVGAIAEAAIMGFALAHRKVSLVPRWCGNSTELGEVLRQCSPVVIGNILMTVTVLIDQSMASSFPSGSVAILGYANNITFFVQSIAYVSLSTAVLPYFSRMIAEHDWKAVSHTLKSWSKIILFISIPLTIVLLVCSTPVVRVIYQRGSFTVEDTSQVAHVLRYYLLQIPFYVLGSLVVRLISSLRANSILAWVTVGNLILKIALNYILGRFIGIGGIAFATSIMYCCSLCGVGIAAHRLLLRSRSRDESRLVHV